MVGTVLWFKDIFDGRLMNVSDCYSENKPASNLDLTIVDSLEILLMELELTCILPIHNMEQPMFDRPAISGPTAKEKLTLP